MDLIQLTLSNLTYNYMKAQSEDWEIMEVFFYTLEP